MSEEHVTAVFGPPHVRESLDVHRTLLHDAHRRILTLRRLLHEHDPSFPDEYDVSAWRRIEES